MRMMTYSSSISRLALLQFLMVGIGVFTTCGTLKLLNYRPDIDMQIRWNPVALAVRSFGIVLLLIPVVWAIACIFLERRYSERWDQRWTIVSGVAILLGIIGLLWWTTVTPYFFQFADISTWDR